MLPALSSGYCKSAFIFFLVSSSVAIKRRSTTFAGISSNTSTVSSTYISSITSSNSESVSALIKSSLMSLFISVNTSAASSFARRRKIKIRCFLSNSSNASTMSTGCTDSSSSFNFLKSCFSSSSIICSTSSLFS